MTAAATVAMCRCGHPQRRHSDDYGCENTECGCTTFREGAYVPVVTPPPVTAPPAVPVRPPSVSGSARPAVQPVGRPTADQILAAGRRSTTKRIAALASRIDAQLVQLADLIRENSAAEQERRRLEAAKAAARQRVADLERQLAEARAALRGATPGATPPSKDGELPCTQPGCVRTFTSEQGVLVHLARSHGIHGANRRGDA